MQFFFGKYKGLPIESADAGYITWCLYNMKAAPHKTKKQLGFIEYVENNAALMQSIEKYRNEKIAALEERAKVAAKQLLLDMLSQHEGSINEKVSIENAIIISSGPSYDGTYNVTKMYNGNNILMCFSKKFKDLEAQKGDVVSFSARITAHRKNNKGINITAVSYPTQIKIVSKAN